MIKRIILKINKNRIDQPGSFLVAALVIILVLTTFGLILATLTTSQYKQTTRNVVVTNADQVAEAGIEQSVNKLNADDSFTGYTTAQTFFDDSTQGYGVFTSTVTTAPDGKSREIISVGKVYRSSSATEPTVTRKIKVIVVGTQSAGYSVYSGPGGLILGGSANVTNSDVYVGGTIKLSGAAGIGTPSKPLNVDVANNVCPTSGGPTYPTTCTSTEPISMAYSTHIYGTVCATGQTSTGPHNNIQTGNGGAGLKPGCKAPAVSQPTYDRQAQINAITNTASGNSNTYTCQSWPFDRTWPDKLELTGNVTIGGSCNLTIKGDVYITGNLTIGGAATVRVDNSVGSTRPVILVDGKISVGGSGQVLSNSSGTGAQFISFKSNAPCDPGCTTITGSDLKNTQNYQTVSVSGASNLAGMVFQAYWGKITVGGSGNLGSAVGQTVDLSGAGTVTFGTKLATGSRTWTISSYQRLY